MVAEREKLIGARLRAFRETLQIPRSKFAVAVGFGSERIASYEAGRAPLPYEVFRAISKRYHVSPLWLATQVNSPKFPNVFDDSDFINLVRPRALFSEVYDKHIMPKMRVLQSEASHKFSRQRKALDLIPNILNDESVPIFERRKWAVALEGLMKKQLRTMRRDVKFRKKASDLFANPLLPEEKSETMSISSKSVLDNAELLSHTAGVQNEIRDLKGLIARLKKVTVPRGAKAALAREFKVTRQAVNQWLSGESNPSADIAIRLQYWKPKLPEK